MAQWNITTQDYLNQERSLFEVVGVASSDGQVISYQNPFPVSLGSSSITINGSVNIPGIVTVSSSPQNPVHNHITEVGTSDILNVPYLPVGIGTTNLNLSYLPVGISSLLNTVSISNTSFYISGFGSPVSISNTSFYILNPVTSVTVGGTVSIANTVSISNTSFFVTGVGSTVNVSVANTAFYVNNNGSVVSETNRFPVSIGTSTINATIVGGAVTATISYPESAVTTWDEPIAISPTPIIQLDCMYGFNDDNSLRVTLNGGSTTEADSMWTVGVGTTANGFASFVSYRFLKYRPGQGAFTRFTALFSPGVPNIITRVGLSNANGGYLFGYNGTRFGIRHVYGYKEQVMTLRIDNASSGTQTLTVTLNNVGYAVTVGAGSSEYVAQQIAGSTIAGWRKEAVGSKVVFLASSTPSPKGPLTGTYSFTSSGNVTAGFTTNRVGLLGTEEWTYQENWNRDTCNTGIAGSDSSAPNYGKYGSFTLDPSKLNVYQIGFRWLGAGIVRFGLEDMKGNIITVHEQLWSNRNTRPHVELPSYRLSYLSSVSGAGATTSAYVKGASAMGAIEGQINPTTYGRSTSAFNTTNRNANVLHHLLSIRNPISRNGKLNTNEILVNDATMSFQGNDPVIAYLFWNAVPATTLTFNELPGTTVLKSETETTFSITDETAIASFVLAGNGTQQFDLINYKLVLPPDSILSVCFTSTSSVTRTATSLVWIDE
jgi:hypothetical protein